MCNIMIENSLSFFFFFPFFNSSTEVLQKIESVELKSVMITSLCNYLELYIKIAEPYLSI